ncbi:MAG: hypothetical protein O4861_23725 [Trichodesmium sp. St16_bin4-tuft]|nr:hypothetical protein [Trichodesmium sp. St2_bin6]MDE5101175.1 hypothetical protein [Trichodesmium sp. St16_bin4-tuft]MDE5103064.1 hypothetical protein [Trichodesmium sp. St19_bin2]
MSLKQTGQGFLTSIIAITFAIESVLAFVNSAFRIQDNKELSRKLSVLLGKLPQNVRLYQLPLREYIPQALELLEMKTVQ